MKSVIKLWISIYQSITFKKYARIYCNFKELYVIIKTSVMVTYSRFDYGCLGDMREKKRS